MLFTAVSALCTPAWAEYTCAWAEATLPGEGVVVVVRVEVVAGRVVAGTVTVTVRVVAGTVAVLGFEDLVGDGRKAAYSTVTAGAE